MMLEISNVIDALADSLPKISEKIIEYNGHKFDDERKKQALEESLLQAEDVVKQYNIYGDSIPIAFGEVRLSGSVIWAGNFNATILQNGKTPRSKQIQNVVIDELLNQDGLNSKLFGFIQKTSDMWAEYFVDFAIAICEGKVDEVFSIEVSGEGLDLMKYQHKVYLGSEEQSPDPLIASVEGNSPAFKGLCYVVFKQFPLHQFGNKIPNFVFSVRRGVSKDNQHSLNQLVKGVTIIPATGEFVYHPEKITKYAVVGTGNGDITIPKSQNPVNYHNNTGKSDVMLSLDDLSTQLPNLEWVSVVVSWFGNSMDIQYCNIYPACEYNDVHLKTTPYEWSVAGINRGNARVVSKDSNGNGRYSGTPSDNSVVELLKELKRRGYKVMLLPMMMMEIEGKPWRGNLTGQSANVSTFFHKNEGYNRFIKHYANLCKNHIDAFAIGSEMRGLTQIRANDGSFPAVLHFGGLANEVRQIVGSFVKLTYASDWSEYHHTQGGFYNMDELWANENIDFIGIDAYFPLTNVSVDPSIEEIEKGWNSGEGWDYYYNYERTEKFPLGQEWAWKNIRWFIENEHINADGTKTKWKPNMKKVWFTEYGFPSVDLCTNQPNVFYDAQTTGSGFPRGSKGRVDFQAQSNAIIATERFWNNNSDIVKNKFVWTWDARPYPFFPRLNNVWGDVENWKFGHWLNGKAVSSFIGDVVSFLLQKAGVENLGKISVSGIVNGIIFKGGGSVKSILQSLSLLYGFKVFEKNGKVNVVEIKNLERFDVDDGDVLIGPAEDRVLVNYKLSRNPISSLAVSFYDVNKNSVQNRVVVKSANYEDGIEYSLSLPLLLSSSLAFNMGKRALFFLNQSEVCEIVLPKSEKYLQIYAGSVIFMQNGSWCGIVEEVVVVNDAIKMVVNKIEKRILEEVEDKNEVVVPNVRPVNYFTSTDVKILDLPKWNGFANASGEFNLGFAFGGMESDGVMAYFSKNGKEFSKIFSAFETGIVGIVANGENNNILQNISDEITKLDVALHTKDLLPSEGLCLVGGELIFFQNAQKLNENTWQISKLFRSMFGSRVEDGLVGKSFVLINEDIKTFSFNENYEKVYFKFVEIGESFESAKIIEFVPHKNSVKFPEITKIQTTIYENEDIEISWIYQDWNLKLGENFKVHLRSFVVEIGNVVKNIDGKSAFVFTKEEQIKANFNGNLSVKVRQV